MRSSSSEANCPVIAISPRTLSRRPCQVVAHDARRPSSGRASVASMRMSVVLPAPLGPRMAKIMPRGTSRSMPSTARKSPKSDPSLGQKWPEFRNQQVQMGLATER